MSAPTNTQRADLGDPAEHTIPRDGDVDLAFAGWLVGTGEMGSPSQHECDWTRGTTVAIYIAVSGRLVTHVRQWSRWQGESEVNRAAAHDTPEAALAWLRLDSEGEDTRHLAQEGALEAEAARLGARLGWASKRAWEAACETLDLDLDVERV